MLLFESLRGRPASRLLTAHGAGGTPMSTLWRHPLADLDIGHGTGGAVHTADTSIDPSASSVPWNLMVLYYWTRTPPPNPIVIIKAPRLLILLQNIDAVNSLRSRTVGESRPCEPQLLTRVQNNG